jgi:isochorismate synthase
MAAIPRCATSCAPGAAGWEQLRTALQRALDAALGRQTAVLFRQHVALPACDPWRLQATLGPAGAPYARWHDGIAGLCAAAWGQIAWHPLSRGGAFAHAQGLHRSLQGQLWEAAQDVDGIDMDAPIAFASFAFGGATAAAGPWCGLDGGVLFVPKCTVYRNGAAAAAPSYAVLSRRLTTATDIAAVFADMQASWGALYAAAACSAARIDDGANAAADRPMGSVSAGATAAPPMAARPPLAPPMSPATPSDVVAWRQRVGQAQRAMAAGVLDKVVLARDASFVSPAEHCFDATATADALRSQHPGAIVYALALGDGRTFMGATPEVLVRLRGQQLQTQAIAGTARRGATTAQDDRLGAALMASDKERHEHAIVADSLQADLAPLCVHLERPLVPRLLRLPRLQHLETPLTGTLRQAGDVLALCDRLHPTPATGGWPRRPARQWLADHEPLDRGLFAGPIGWIGPKGDGTFAVALRSVLVTPQRAHAFAGAGIVSGSEPAAEWRETELKLTTAADALRLLPTGLKKAGAPGPAPAKHHVASGAQPGAQPQAARGL